MDVLVIAMARRDRHELAPEVGGLAKRDLSGRSRRRARRWPASSPPPGHRRSRSQNPIGPI